MDRAALGKVDRLLREVDEIIFFGPRSSLRRQEESELPDGHGGPRGDGDGLAVGFGEEGVFFAAEADGGGEVGDVDLGVGVRADGEVPGGHDDAPDGFVHGSVVLNGAYVQYIHFL